MHIAQIPLTDTHTYIHTQIAVGGTCPHHLHLKAHALSNKITMHTHTYIHTHKNTRIQLVTHLVDISYVSSCFQQQRNDVAASLVGEWC